MIKWIFIVMLLEQSPVTGEVQWAEAVRIENISYETCIELVVDTVVMEEGENLRIDPWCEPQKEKKEEETKDK